jgi:ribosomal protein S20
LKTLTKRFHALAHGQKITEAKELLHRLIRKLDRAAQKHMLHRRTASRKIARLSHLFHTLQSKAA